jgi:hypothetical protein
VPVRKPKEMPVEYRRAYWSNWWRRATRRPADTTLRGKCVGCHKDGVLAFDLVHRGPTRSTNLMCDSCFETG